MNIDQVLQNVRKGNIQEFDIEDNIIQICWFVLNKIIL